MDWFWRENLKREHCFCTQNDWGVLQLFPKTSKTKPRKSAKNGLLNIGLAPGFKSNNMWTSAWIMFRGFNGWTYFKPDGIKPRKAHCRVSFTNGFGILLRLVKVMDQPKFMMASYTKHDQLWVHVYLILSFHLLPANDGLIATRNGASRCLKRLEASNKAGALTHNMNTYVYQQWQP